MALRIADIVQHGWLDNTSPGVTKGEVYVVGHKSPIKIFLKGNSWRDMAGTRMHFRNPNPEMDEETFATLRHLQKGVVGDITCSIKRKVPTIPMTELEDYFEAKREIPYKWKNALFIEWFSIANGRVTIESTEFEITLSAHEWALSEQEERQQRAKNSNAMNQFIQLAIDMVETEADISFDSEDEVDEYEWEKRLRVRDNLEEAQWMLDENLQVDEDDNETSTNDIPIEKRHMLVQLAHHTHETIMGKLGDSVLDSGPRGALAAAIGYVLSATNDAWPDKGLGIETGYRFAVMKRSLLACNHAVAHCNTLSLEDSEFESIRTEIHHLRDCTLDTIRHLRKESKMRQDESAEPDS